MDQTRAERRRTWKRNARVVVKKHYVILLLLVLLGIFYGGEFQYVKSQYNDTYKLFTGRDPQSSDVVPEIGSSSPFEFAFDLLGINDELQQKDQEKAADNQSSSTQKAHSHGDRFSIFRELLLCHYRPCRAAARAHERKLRRNFSQEVLRLLDRAQVSTDSFCKFCFYEQIDTNLSIHLL